MKYQMWYAVELKEGFRQSEGVRNMGSESAMKNFVDKHQWSSAGWTLVAVDEEGLANLPFRVIPFQYTEKSS